MLVGGVETEIENWYWYFGGLSAGRMEWAKEEGEGDREMREEGKGKKWKGDMKILRFGDFGEC